MANPVDVVFSDTLSFAEMKPLARQFFGGDGSDGVGVSQAADATITVGAEVGDARAITIQLLDAFGNEVTQVEQVEIGLFLNAARTAYVATGGSTGIAIGTDGALLPIVAKKYWKATSEADGDIDLTWTDTGTEAAYLGIFFPASGKWKMSAALTNGA